VSLWRHALQHHMALVARLDMPRMSGEAQVLCYACAAVYMCFQECPCLRVPSGVSMPTCAFKSVCE